jgi:uncharacterized repeat protein (TIGR03803 family)
MKPSETVIPIPIAIGITFVLLPSILSVNTFSRKPAMMKNLPICLLLLLSVCANSQPQLVGTLANSGPLAGGSVFRNNLPVTTPGTIRTFDHMAPHQALGGVITGDADWLYGMLAYNGTNQEGAFYKIKRDGTGFTKIYDITAPIYVSAIPFYHTDGLVYFSTGTEVKKYNPATSAMTTIPLAIGAPVQRTMTIDENDWMYFLSSVQTAVLSKVKTDGSQTVNLHTFNGTTDGWNGIAGITSIPGDSIVGLTLQGGVNDMGTIYSIKKDGTDFTILHQFAEATGKFPESKLVYFNGKLYGTTQQGGDFVNGVLYSINPDGSNYTVLHHFEQHGPSQLYGNITITSNGRIFGVYGQFAIFGGTFRAWKIDTSGSNFEEFMNVDQRESGHFNQDPLILSDDNTIFLVTAELGRHEGGALSQCDTSGNISGLYQFGTSPNGFHPNPLMKASNGKLYGTTTIGGPSGNGTIYSMNADGSGYVKLHEFNDAEGYEPNGKLMEASDGKLYGVCRWGGPSNSGAIYRIDKSGTIVEDNAGVLYGTTSRALTQNGSVYKINKDGTGFAVLKLFLTSDIYTPFDGLALDNGWLYGTCNFGGAEGKGGLYRLHTDGSGYQTLHDFTGVNSGAQPRGIPLIASNGKLYGITLVGGATGEGTLYSMDLTGTNFTTLRQFVSTSDGGFPFSSMIQASDGLLYGSNPFGGPGFGGTIYRTNLDGSNFTLINSFDVSSQGQTLNGILDLNGNFVLPVELIAFAAEKKNSGVLLTWKTAQEQNSDHFEIERSAGGNNFITIGKVKAAGNTTAITSYSFTDQNPFNGINLYRLKQVDMDEKFDYSKTIPVDCSTVGSIVISPNPVIDKLQLRLPVNSRFTSLRILDVSGKPVFQKAILSSGTTQQFDIGYLPKGWYVLQLLGEKEEKQVFVKQ